METQVKYRQIISVIVCILLTLGVMPSRADVELAISPELAEIVGSKPIPRTEVTKKLWAYIKKNDLQDNKNRRNINADSKLRPIFNKGTVSMFEMTIERIFSLGKKYTKIAVPVTAVIINNVIVGELENPSNHFNIDYKQLNEGYYETALILNNLISFGFGNYVCYFLM